MARAPKRDSLTPADEVRRLLCDCEQALGSLKDSSDNALTILRGLDRLHGLLPKLEAGGMDLRPERTRLAGLEGEIQRRASDVHRAMRRVGGLARARQALGVDGLGWWWYLDEQVRKSRCYSIRRSLLSVTAAVAVLLVLWAVYQRFVAPDPMTARGLELQVQGEMLARTGDYAGALKRLDEAEAMLPTSGELHVWRGVLSALTGESARADELFDEGLALLQDASVFLVVRGQAYLQLQELDSAEADAALVLQSDPCSPEGHLLRGSVLEARGTIGEAIASFEAASRCAEERGLSQLSAVARLRMGMLSQQGSMPQLAP